MVQSDDNAKSKSDKDDNASGAEKPASNLEETGYQFLLTNKLCTCFHFLSKILFYNILSLQLWYFIFIMLFNFLYSKGNF